jgi:hypothetical protein
MPNWRWNPGEAEVDVLCYMELPLYPRALKETPRFAAMTLVAPIVRFNAVAILVTPCLSFAIDFNVRRSSLVHGRPTAFFLFCHVGSFFENRASSMAPLVCNAPRSSAPRICKDLLSPPIKRPRFDTHARARHFQSIENHYVSR